MLIQFAVANYRSIKDEAVLSLVAGPGREHRERNVALLRDHRTDQTPWR